MQHQILGLRDFIKDGKLKKYDAFFEKGWCFDDLQECFKNPQTYLADVPNEERLNLYFTIAKCSGKREFRSQKYVPFDIDHVDIGKTVETVTVALGSLGLSFDSTLSLFSGNGVQFHVELEEAFEDPNYFEQERIYYKACCDRINAALKEAGLPGSADPSVWSESRLMRMPQTLNVKPDKAARLSEVLNDRSTPIKFSLSEASGLPRVGREENISRWPPPDTEAVLEGCENLRRMRDEPDSITEPLWYACASIVGHLGGNVVEARRLWHELSSRYKGYVASEADRKLDQARSASGPRTCSNFATIEGSKCLDCKYFQKLKSPILIIGEDYIKTKGSGFYSVGYDAEGKLVLGKPQYEDLRKFFEQTYPYVVNSESGGIFTFKKSHYESFPELMVKGFAQENFKSCDQRKASEFSSLVKRTNLKLPAWFAETTEYKMNFQNGVLDVKSGKFETGSSRELGFMFTLDFDYDARATAPIFERFLNDITCGDPELRQLLLEFGGYALSNDEYWEHKALLLVGDGSNGKNTYMQVLKDLAGKGGYSAISMKNLSNEQHLARLEGKLFNISEEASALAFRDTDAFKTICSGGEINVKTVYERPYDIVNRAKIIIACNDIPESKDGSYGFYRRFAVAPFNATFTELNRDVNLSHKLRAERAGILNMFLSAFAEMKARGHILPTKAGQEKLRQYRVSNDPILQWFTDSITVDPIAEAFTKNTDIFNSYTGFCSVDNVRTVSREALFMRLSKLIPDFEKRKARKKVDGKTERVWFGISLGNKESF